MNVPIPSRWWFAVVAAILSAIAVGEMRRYALHRSILDVPNERSSHSAAVPRGGGLGMVLVFVVLALGVPLRPPVRVVTWVYLLALVAVAFVGWLDDRAGVRVRVRLAVHAAAGAALAALAFAAGETVIWCAWWMLWAISSINVVNFMDGIDGLVASQCAVFAVSIARLTPSDTASHMLALVLCGVCVGFLSWNWPPARIFMGDVGSGTLGALCALVGMLAILDAPVGFVRAYLPLFPLFLDAAWTVSRRLRNGERITEAHRTHLYQRLANGGWGHRRVTMLYLAAAATGVAVAAVGDEVWRTALVVVYGACVIVVGAALDRTRPFAWRESRPMPSSDDVGRDMKRG
jgi:UDP-N-acetylmuramyl pentapeptide phosphotransferase/UDP-N-acetylglucosamine-1-phosphate transferase